MSMPLLAAILSSVVSMIEWLGMDTNNNNNNNDGGGGSGDDDDDSDDGDDDDDDDDEVSTVEPIDRERDEERKRERDREREGCTDLFHAINQPDMVSIHPVHRLPDTYVLP